MRHNEVAERAPRRAADVRREVCRRGALLAVTGAAGACTLWAVCVCVCVCVRVCECVSV